MIPFAALSSAFTHIWVLGKKLTGLFIVYLHKTLIQVKDKIQK